MSDNLVQYVVAAGNGDTDAMAKLYSKTLKASYFLASKLCESEAEAVEIIKKAYARAFCSIDKLKKPEAFEIWVKQIVAAIYKDGANFIYNDADGSAQEASAEFLPEAILEDEAMAAKVMDAMSKLTAERKAAIILHYYTGMPASALARYFGVSESTANAILAKAKADVAANAGVSAPEYPELATLPVLTRLFKDLVAKMGIDNNVVRDVFVFAVEAYAEANKVVAAETEPAEEVAEEKEESAAEEKAEEPATEEAETEEEKEESAEEPAEVEEAEAEVEEEAEDETEAEEETVEEIKNEMEESILSFKNKISSMLGEEPESETEEPAEESEAETEAEPAEEVAEEASEEVEETEVTEVTEVTEEVMPIDDDAFERIKRSIDGMADDVQSDSDNESTLAFADFAPEKDDVTAEPEDVAAKDETVKPAKKAVKLNPKILIAAAVILVVIVVAVVLIVKGGKGKEESVTEPTTVGYSNEAVNWVALLELSAYKEIEYLNESVSSFKDPDTGKYGLIDYKGNIVLDAEYDSFRRCSSGRYYGEGKLSDSGYHIVAVKGGVEYEVVMLDESSATLSNQVHSAHATTNGTNMSGGDYDERDRYYEGYAAVRKDGKWGYVAQGGKIVVPYEFEAVNDVPTDDPTGAFDYCRGSVNGYVAVKKDGKMGIIRIDKDSYRIVADYKYDMICQGKNGVFLAYNGTEWGNIVIGSAPVDGGNNDEVTTLKPVETKPAEVSIGNYVVISDETNIRSAPDTEKENVIAALDEGYKVAALEIKQGSNGSDWVRFDYNGQEAWVSIKKLDKAD